MLKKITKGKLPMAPAKEAKPASKMPLVDKSKTDKANNAQKALEDYLKSNKLDPTKDWSKDKKHGVKIKELVAATNVARKQVEAAAPKEIHHKKSEDKKSSAGPKATYDYPKVDGKEMSADEKKKYRQKMRKEGNGVKPQTPKAEAPKAKAKVEEVKATSKAKAQDKAPVKGHGLKKKKKVSRDED